MKSYEKQGSLKDEHFFRAAASKTAESEPKWDMRREMKGHNEPGGLAENARYRQMSDRCPKRHAKLGFRAVMCGWAVFDVRIGRCPADAAKLRISGMVMEGS
jgi:hypothetical protein